jgi:hypothetical protein
MTATVSFTKCSECRSIKNLSELVKNEQDRWQCQDTAACAREKAESSAGAAHLPPGSAAGERPAKAEGSS